MSGLRYVGFWAVCACLLPATALPATTVTKSNDSLEKAGTVIAFALPATAAGISLWKSDWDGLVQLALVTGATVGTTFALKQVIHEERPDGSDDKSFPSDTAALAFAPAQYLWERYGWEYGAPAYLAGGFVAYSRVESRQHHWWDVAASAGLAFGFGKLLTSHYQNPNLYGSAYLVPGGGYVTASYRW
jgi:membrane-associated phospholipid phosphatase